MFVISACVENLEGLLIPVCNVSPIVVAKIGSFTKCAYQWLPNVLQNKAKEIVEQHTDEVLVYTVDSANDLGLNEAELRMCHKELTSAYVNRVCTRSSEITLPRSAWFETEEDGGDKYAHVSVLAIDSKNQTAKIRFLSGPLKDDMADVHLSEFPAEWLDDLIY